MSDFWEFEMHVKGHKEAVEEFCNSFYPVDSVYKDSYEEDGEDDIVCLKGSCYEQLSDIMVDTGDEESLAEKTKRGSLEVEVFGLCEYGYLQHIHYKNGECIVNDDSEDGDSELVEYTEEGPIYSFSVALNNPVDTGLDSFIESFSESDDKDFFIATIGGDKKTLFGYNGSDRVVEIPEGIIMVSADAFYQLDFLEEVYVPNSVIHLYGFEECVNLKKIVIPESVQNFSDESFEGAENLVIHTVKGSAAEAFAKEKGIAIEYINYAE